VAVVIRCPFCKTKFRWKAETDDYPKNCPECDAYVGHDRADDDVVVPNILAFSTRCQDGVYKAMERASEERVYQAAEMAGCSPSEMSSLKITNMRDNMRQGDIAAMPVQNDVTRQMEVINARGGQFGFGGGDTGLGFSTAVPTGPLPNAGARFQRVVNDSHPDMVARHAVGRDETGRHVVPSTDVRSARPANEIFNPGYRPRI